MAELIATATMSNVLSASATFSQVVQGAEPPTGDATVDQVLVGATFSNADEIGLTGTMPNIGQQNITPTSTDQYISEGYHDGTGIVSGAPIANAKNDIDTANEEVSADLDAGIALVSSNYSAIKAAIEAKGVDMTGVIPSGYDDKISETGGNAAASDLVAGKTATVDSGKITGIRRLRVVYKTGQTTSYADYDDGYYGKGEASINPRFVDNGDGTQTDLETGLMWQKEIQSQRNWTNAISYCESLELGGHTDWRLPNAAELVSLFYAGFNGTKLPFPNGHFFSYADGVTPGSSAGAWSSTTSGDSSSVANYFGLAYTHLISQRAKSTTLDTFVFAVRGPIAL